MEEAGDSSRVTVHQVSGNGIGKELSDSRTDVVPAAAAASFSGGNEDLDAGVDESPPVVGLTNGRTGCGHEKVDEIGKELLDSSTDVIAKDETVKDSCQSLPAASSVSGGNGDLEAGVPDVGLANGRAGGGQEKLDAALDEGGKVAKTGSYVIEMSWDEGGEKVCRICHLMSSEGSILEGAAVTGVVVTSMELIQLGCGCKDELGVVHSHCGEAWFKLKGNRVCEICGETAKNITGVADNIRFMEEWNQMRLIHTNPAQSGRGGGGCWRGQPFCNFLMACLVIAFVLPWFFRVNMF
ncbi:hypothetical protein LINGRAPRIM_LOCUS1434 [Linum grandiflorum]